MHSFHVVIKSTPTSYASVVWFQVKRIDDESSFSLVRSRCVSLLGKRFVWRFLDQIGLRERPSRLNGKEDEKEIGEKEV